MDTVDSRSLSVSKSSFVRSDVKIEKVEGRRESAPRQKTKSMWGIRVWSCFTLGRRPRNRVSFRRCGPFMFIYRFRFFLCFCRIFTCNSSLDNSFNGHMHRHRRIHTYTNASQTRTHMPATAHTQTHAHTHAHMPNTHILIG